MLVVALGGRPFAGDSTTVCKLVEAANVNYTTDVVYAPDVLFLLRALGSGYGALAE